MRKLLSIALAAAAVLTAVLFIHQHMQYNDWHNSREVIEYRVHDGDTLYDIGYAHKPSWLDVREYCYEVLALNGMDSSDLYAGQTIKIYAIIGE